MVENVQELESAKAIYYDYMQSGEITIVEIIKDFITDYTSPLK